MYVPCVQYAVSTIQSELSDSQKSVVGQVVAEALADDFSTGFRPEDSSHHQNE